MDVMLADHLEVAGHVIQHLGHVLAELGHPLAAVGAFTGAVTGRLVHDLVPRQMIRQRLALRLAALANRGHGSGGIALGIGMGFRRGFGLSGFEFLEPQFELLDLQGDALRRERPNCMRRSLAICNLSFSISSVLYCTDSSATLSSLWQARAKARSETISSGSSAVASDMPEVYSAIS
jgi:hypothetical protein